MSNLALTFKDLYDKVTKFLGTYGSSGATGDELTDAKEIVNDAYRRFLTAKKWSFLYPLQQITTQSGTNVYDLPVDFVALKGKITYSANDNKSDLTEITHEKWLSLVASNDYSGWPEFYCLVPEKFDHDIGTKWQLKLYPTPDAAYTLQMPIQIMPLKLDQDDDLPAGGPELSDCIRLVCLAEAEATKEEKLDLYEGKAVRAIEDAFMLDRRRKSRSVGHMGGHDIDSRLLWREMRFNDVTYLTD